MIDIHVLSLAYAEAIKTEYCEKHFPLRLAKARRFKQKEDYLRSIGAGYLLFEVLELEDKDIEIDKYGKPSAKTLVSGKNKLFNLSHSGNYIVLATNLSDDGLAESIGVDIEEVSERRLGMIEKILLPDELEWVNTTDSLAERASRFTQLWTVKEACLKAIGTGVSLSNIKFSCLSAISEKFVKINNDKFYTNTIELEGYYITVASKKEKTASIIRHDLF